MAPFLQTGGIMRKIRKLYIIVFIIAMCMTSNSVNAEGYVEARIPIITDGEKVIIFESISDGTTESITVNKEAEKIITYNEPGIYQYKVYESKDDANRDEREYFATIFIAVNEETNKFDDPVIVFDNVDGSGKPSGILFGDINKDKSDENSDGNPNESTETADEEKNTEDKEKTSTDGDSSKKNKNGGSSDDGSSNGSGSSSSSNKNGTSKTSTSAKTADFLIFALCISSFLLAMMTIFTSKNNKHHLN